MNKNIQLKYAAVLLLIFLGFITACNKKEPQKYANSGPTFSIDKFELELKNSISPSGAIGWSYIIAENGLYARGGAFGKARNNFDVSKSFTLNRKINIASVTKYLTAIAALQLLERRGISINSKVMPWLPPTWQKGPGVSELTFAELLGHSSGLSSYNSNFPKTLGYTGLRLMIDTGVIRSKSYSYLNANFALFRILIPSLWKGLNDAPTINVLDSATTASVYIQYMQEKIFEPIGLNNIDCEPEARSIATLYYSTADQEVSPGVYYTSWASMAGGGGFFMTSMELATVVAYYKHSQLLLSNSSRAIMEDNRFGFELKDDAREIHGNYFAKNGSISNGNNQGTFEQIVIFPNNIETIVMFNTQGMVFAGGETNIRRAIFDAYNKAWD